MHSTFAYTREYSLFTTRGRMIAIAIDIPICEVAISWVIIS